ncbi:MULTISPECIES: hypothetical protein [Burkholderiaceae]|uniref:hypothetical protein n=1 Tax=Burkholderiaceae TaxID=119060 RepID=UPI0002A1B9F6|nr:MULTISPECIES: hypothetical protein [Burkholderiaceae]EKZ97850.1 hypothetical protein D769_18069 [Cupriavidus sp. HMR-1]KVS16375.1 hypothetical protein WK32_26805 [Burkholderia vietnamiensis]MDR8057749.1 hypothetical protein [Burkholderia cenocepacia]MDR8062159.1 hypothetical protein [Burkholderia cenocepacia]
MTRTQQRIATTNVLAQDVPFSIPAQQKADVVKLDRDTCLHYDLTGGPVYVTREAAESPYIEQALEWFTDAPGSIETGMTVVIAPGLECLFGFDPHASNRDAFFLYIWKN